MTRGLTLPTRHTSPVPVRRDAWKALRVGWTVLTVVVVEIIVCGAAVLPAALLWRELLMLTAASSLARALVVSLVAVPSYVLFALLLMFWSATSVRLLRWHTPPDMRMRIADLDWPLLAWARSMVATHVVRFFAGALFRGSPMWTAYLRLAGARLGRGVRINTLAITDYNLLTMGDNVVVGDGVHLSGHTVEAGVVTTAPSRIGSDVTLGLGSVLSIGVEVEDGCVLAALSFVPKHTRLGGGQVYAGIPARRVSGRTLRK